MLLRRTLLATAAMASLLLVAGCRAEEATSVRFDGSGNARTTVSLEVSGEARDALRRSPALAASLESAARQRFPSLRREDRDGTLRWTAATTPDQVGAASGVLGISRLEVRQGDQPSLSADLVRPTELESAVRDGLTGDAAAAVAPIMENTWVTLRVSFPGPVTSATSSGPRLQRGDRSVVVRQPLAAYRTGTVTVAGRTSDGTAFRNTALVAVALGSMAALVLVLRRRPTGGPR